MLQNRVVRGYVVLLAGLLVFFGRRLLAGESLLGDSMMGAEIRSEAEIWIVVVTAALTTQAVALGRARAMLIALPFALPPLMLYITFYPTVIVFLMLLMLPWLVHAALGAWLPEQGLKS
ncbi:MAG: hypothetical protein RLZZ387_5169 [Chloroflexota bacterium]|jgi:fatty acid desaturase